MASSAAKAKASLLILLLLGNDVVNAYRITVSQHSNFTTQSCPADDSGCSNTEGYTCEPVGCCLYKSGITNMFNRCVLDYPYKSDEFLMKRFAAKMKTLVRTVDAFRHEGGLWDFSGNGGMKSLTNVMEVLKAANSEENGAKTWFRYVAGDFYALKGLEKFKFELDALKADSGYDFEVFSLGDVDFPYQFNEDSWTYNDQETAAQWVARCLREGLEKALNGMSGGPVDGIKKMLADLENVNDENDVRAVIQEAMPDKSPDEIVAAALKKMDEKSEQTEDGILTVAFKSSGSLLQVHEGSVAKTMSDAERSAIAFLLLLVALGICAYVLYGMMTTKVRVSVSGRSTGGGGYAGRTNIRQTDGFGEVFNFNYKWKTGGRR